MKAFKVMLAVLFLVGLIPLAAPAQSPVTGVTLTGSDATTEVWGMYGIRPYQIVRFYFSVADATQLKVSIANENTTGFKYYANIVVYGKTPQKKR